jgi:hypothetical protein
MRRMELIMMGKRTGTVLAVLAGVAAGSWVMERKMLLTIKQRAEQPPSTISSRFEVRLISMTCPLADRAWGSTPLVSAAAVFGP